MSLSVNIAFKAVTCALHRDMSSLDEWCRNCQPSRLIFSELHVAQTTQEDVAWRFVKDSQRQIQNWPSALFFPKVGCVCGSSFMFLSLYDVRAHVVQLHIGQRLSVMRFRLSGLGLNRAESESAARCGLRSSGLSSGDRGGKDGTVHLELMKKCNAHMQHEGSCRITACHSHLEATFVTSKERGAGRQHYPLQTPLPHQFLLISLS